MHTRRAAAHRRAVRFASRFDVLLERLRFVKTEHRGAVATLT